MRQNPSEQKSIEDWLSQLQQGTPDPQLTQKLAAQLAGQKPKQIHQLFTFLSSTPEEQEIEMWLQSWLAEELPIAEAIPHFDLSFLPPTTGRSPAAPSIPANTMNQVKEHFQSWFIHFAQLLLEQPSPVLVARTGEVESKLMGYTLPEEAAPWGGEVAVFAQDDTTCRVEVAIYRIDVWDADLANIPVTLHLDELSQTLYTDAGGVVEFVGIPRAGLTRVEVRIGAEA